MSPLSPNSAIKLKKSSKATKSSGNSNINTQPLIPFDYLPQQLKNSLSEAYSIAKNQSKNLEDCLSQDDEDDDDGDVSSSQNSSPHHSSSHRFSESDQILKSSGNHTHQLLKSEDSANSVSKSTGKPLKKQKNPCKRRYSWTTDQKKHLENHYKINPLPSLATREELAKELGVGVKNIQFWFQNKRCHDPHKIRRERGRPPLGFRRLLEFKQEPGSVINGSELKLSTAGTTSTLNTGDSIPDLDRTSRARSV
jgi:hypothetical protein